MFDNGTLQPVADFRSLVTYGVTNEEIEAKKAAFAALEFTTPKGYEEGRKAIRELVTLRTSIEDRRKALKRDSLEFGRFVDSEAKRWTSLIESIEEPLKLKKAVIDDEKDRVRREKEAAEKAKQEAEERAKREAEEARLKAIRDEEERKLAEERKALEAEKSRMAEEKRKADEAARVERERMEAEQRAERERLAAERAKIEAEQRAERERQEAIRKAEEEKLAEERRAIEAERRRVEAEREAQERAEFERQARIKAEQEAKAKAEREAREAEERRIAEAEQKEAERKRMEALRPDLEKVELFAELISAILPPSVASNECRAVIELAMKRLAHTAGELKAFALNSTKKAA